MPDMKHWSQPQDHSAEENIPDKVQALLAEVEEVSKTLREIAEHLLPSYPPESLLHLSRVFENIGQRFANFSGLKSHPFYNIIHQSNTRRSAVNSVAKEANRLALLFEKYARSPDRYSAVHSRTQIHRLQMTLENLKSVLPSASAKF